MQNNDVSKRLYNKHGNPMSQDVWHCKDLVDAIKTMEKQVSDITTKEQGYKEIEHKSTASTNTSSSSEKSTKSQTF